MWSTISTVPRAKRPDVVLQLTNLLAANYENHIGKSSVTSGRFARGTVQTTVSFCARPSAGVTTSTAILFFMTDKKKESDEPDGQNAAKTAEGDDSEMDDLSSLKPVRPKVGESEDNLKQRSEWFQKRRGRK